MVPSIGFQTFFVQVFKIVVDSSYENSKLGKMPQKRMECFRLLFDHLA